MKKIIIIVPAIIPTGPVKGAIAMCNGLVPDISVTLLSLKPSDYDQSIIDPRVEQVNLGKIKSWYKKYRLMKDVLLSSGGREHVMTISYCFSADLFTLFLKPHSTIVSYIRGNLHMNYKYEYGYLGLLLAQFHYRFLRYYDSIISMSNAMNDQLNRFKLDNIWLIRNFIDELHINDDLLKTSKKYEKFTFIFAATLSDRKRPKLMVRAFKSLIEDGIDCNLIILGDGPLRIPIENTIRENGLKEYVSLKGFQSNPIEYIKKSHCMVLPSESEGISRALMEGLFCGIPCVARDIDGNKELINNDNGILFNKDSELAACLKKMIGNVKAEKYSGADNLLPTEFRQNYNVKQILGILQK